jgi:hypothetical protein
MRAFMLAGPPALIRKRSQLNSGHAGCNNDPAILLSSAFEMQSTNRAQVELPQPQSLSLKNGTTGQLIGRVDPVKSANMYEGRIKPSDGDWLPSVFTGDSQHIIFDGLTRGKDYTAQVRTLGGSTGQSDWRRPRTCGTFHFLNSLANASRASVGGPDEVSRSTTIRVANSSHWLRACLFTIRAGIDLLHSRRAPGSKCVH